MRVKLILILVLIQILNKDPYPWSFLGHHREFKVIIEDFEPTGVTVCYRTSKQHLTSKSPRNGQGLRATAKKQENVVCHQIPTETDEIHKGSCTLKPQKQMKF